MRRPSASPKNVPGRQRIGPACRRRSTRDPDTRPVETDSDGDRSGNARGRGSPGSPPERIGLKTRSHGAEQSGDHRFRLPGGSGGDPDQLGR